jgi:hypothetical protein
MKRPCPLRARREECSRVLAVARGQAIEIPAGRRIARWQRAAPQTSQADSGGSIPLTRSDDESSGGKQIPNPKRRLFSGLTGCRAINRLLGARQPDAPACRRRRSPERQRGQTGRATCGPRVLPVQASARRGRGGGKVEWRVHGQVNQDAGISAADDESRQNLSLSWIRCTVQPRWWAARSSAGRTGRSSRPAAIPDWQAERRTAGPPPII